MRYLHQEVKTRKGETIKVDLSGKTRVLIMSQRQFKKYQNHSTFTYFGGIKEGSYEFVSPKDSRWVIVVEKGTRASPLQVTAHVSIVPAEPRAPRAKVEAAAEPEHAEEIVEEVAEPDED